MAGLSRHVVPGWYVTSFQDGVSADGVLKAVMRWLVGVSYFKKTRARTGAGRALGWETGAGFTNRR